MSENKKDSALILDLIGGKENLVSITHCVTRLRLVLKDESKADKKGLENLDIVKCTLCQGQFKKRYF